MKKFFSWVLILFTILFVFSQREPLTSRANYLLRSPCSQPVGYRVGAVDKGYQMSNQQFLDRVEKAAAIWNQTAEKNLFQESRHSWFLPRIKAAISNLNKSEDKAKQTEGLFVYQPQSELAVNLIYSQRQSALDSLDKLQGELSSGKKSLDSTVTEYKKLSADFKTRLTAFNSEVESWMKQGGAPPDVYEKLIKEQEDLKAEADRLNATAKKLDQSVENYNVRVGEFNQNVQSYNQVVVEKPEAGLYDGSIPKIDIYLTISEAELIHTLAHELGHALGLEHVMGDPKAIMYPFSSEAIVVSPQDVDSLQAFCQDIRIISFLKEKFGQFKLNANK